MLDPVQEFRGWTGVRIPVERDVDEYVGIQRMLQDA